MTRANKNRPYQDDYQPSYLAKDTAIAIFCCFFTGPSFFVC